MTKLLVYFQNETKVFTMFFLRKIYFWSLLLIISIMASTFTIYAEKGHWHYKVRVWYPPFDLKSPNIQIKYRPLEESSSSWKICVAFPATDAYWTSFNHGVTQEARRLGVSLKFADAGGYANLNRQIEQIKECAKEASAVIIGAISSDALNSVVSDLRSKGIVVIDAVNGMSTKQMSAKTLISYEYIAQILGEYLARLHPKGFSNVNVAWFPGPKGVGFVTDANKGFTRAIRKGAISITSIQYGGLSTEDQLVLVKKALQENPNLDYIIGTAPTAEAAVKYLREINRERDVKVVSYYINPFVYDAIEQGKVFASPTDSTVIQGKLSVDQAVRILDDKPVLRHIGPEIYILSASTLHLFPRENLLAP